MASGDCPWLFIEHLLCVGLSTQSGYPSESLRQVLSHSARKLKLRQVMQLAQHHRVGKQQTGIEPTSYSKFHLHTGCHSVNEEARDRLQEPCSDLWLWGPGRYTKTRRLTPWLPSPALPPNSCVTLRGSLNLSVPKWEKKKKIPSAAGVDASGCWGRLLVNRTQNGTHVLLQVLQKG